MEPIEQGYNVESVGKKSLGDIPKIIIKEEEELLSDFLLQVTKIE
ncbi:hypothetical protein SAMN06265348_110251 [Pedobacter westerhofensis]|uniref:Uncharacterized protein n=1 Tax=Pedobacter westerhofensis TaxID=425512 RepID=A0A521F759_9SPHI|nr:hypothetical protein [Pedobacter westerhofensis]SMO92029.1 hypothetical protein SAMN06265348_110251 [Pedobacter westerhofensis]